MAAPMPVILVLFGDRRIAEACWPRKKEKKIKEKERKEKARSMFTEDRASKKHRVIEWST